MQGMGLLRPGLWRWLLCSIRRPCRLARAAAQKPCADGTVPAAAQMEKRADASSPAERHARVRSILQRGLGFNPSSACLAQV